MDHEPVLIDEIVLHQRPQELWTADDQDVLAGLLLQFGYFFLRHFL